MEFRILGSLEVVDQDRVLPVGRGKQRALLGFLLLHANEVVSTDALIDELWGESPRANARQMLQMYISRLRKALAAGGEDGVRHEVLVTSAAGYSLRIEPWQVDARRFEHLAREGSAAMAAGDPVTADSTLREALGLWRGRPLADIVDESFARTEIARLEELRLAAVESRTEAGLALGHHRELVGELEAMIADHPLRERLRGQLMLALYRCGRQADALAIYRRTAATLREELGLEPWAELRRLQEAILSHDPELGEPDVAAVGGGRQPDAPLGANARPSHRKRTWQFIAGLVTGAGLLVALGVASSSSPGPVAANSVVVIDPHANRVVGSVGVGARPGALSFGEGALWVANVDDATVSRVDARARRVMRTIAVGDPPVGLAAGAGGVWVTTSHGGVREIDPRFNSVGLVRPQAPNYLSEGDVDLPAPIVAGIGAVWAASRTIVSRFDPREPSTVQTYGVGLSPAGLAVGMGAAWVTDSVLGTLTRIDPATNATHTTPVGDDASAVAIGSGAVWVALSDADSVVRVDPTTRAVVTTIRVGKSPSGLAVGAGAVWVANAGSGTVSRIDPRSDRVVATIDVGNSPDSIVLAAGRVWVSVPAGPSRTTSPALPTGGGVARVDLQSDNDLRSLDPALADSPDATQIQYATCAKLFNYPDRAGSAGDQLVPDAAIAPPTVSPDGRTYTLRIRNGLRFSPPSNAPVTAHTFLHTIERTLSPRMGSSADAFMGDVVGANSYMAGKSTSIAGLTASGNELTIRLTEPGPDLPRRLASPYFCAVPDDTPLDPNGVRGIPSAGPFYVADYTPGQQIVLARNPNYNGPRPRRIGQFIYTVGVAPARSVRRVESDLADYIAIGQLGSIPYPVGAQLLTRYGPTSSAARAGRQRYFLEPTPGILAIWLNTSRPLFASVRLRRALNYAIDRHALLHELEASSGPQYLPTDQYLPPEFPGYRTVRAYPLDQPDLATARRIAGPGSHGSAVLYAGAFSAADDEIIARALRAIGIQPIVKHLASAVLFDRERRPGEPFDLVNGGYGPGYADPFAILNLSFNGRYIGQPEAWNISHFNDPIYNRKLDAAARLSGAARYEAYARLDAELTANAAPMLAWGVISAQDFFSRRMGCQVDQPRYGMDLGALCIRSG